MTLKNFLRPYAAKAIVEHHFDTDHLDIYVTFRFQMIQDVKPANGLWLVEVNEVEKAVAASAWQDAYTMLLTINNIPVLPEKVTLSFDGPSENLKITWDKQWEPWSEIVSIELPPVSTTRTFSTGPAQQDDIDVSNVNILFIDATGNDVVIGGFVGGINGQILHIARLDGSTNDVTVMNHAGGGNQDIHLQAEANETLAGEHGGWALACDGDEWYDTGHAKHI